MSELAELGVAGLATMGANLARNAARHGFPVAVYHRHAERTDQLISAHGSEGKFLPAHDIAGFVAAVAKPRPILLMVKAGKPVDDMIAEFLPHLEAGDILIDGGNSLFSDTRRREAALRKQGLRFVGMGVSGGEEGALLGPSMMPGGERDAYRRIEKMVTRMAAQVDGMPCCTYIGPDGAGHYVKMVHNGIEYADMQLIAEAYDLMGQVNGMDAARIADTFDGWRQGELDSYLIEITTTVLRARDADGKARVDAILDEAEQKGTGRWTAQSALELGVPITAITEAVFARALSARRALRGEAAKLYPRAKPRGEAIAVNDIQDALYASKIVAYAQGFEQLAAASDEYKWDLHPGEIATIWRGGCIIRAKFLDRIREAYEAGPVQNLLLAEYFREAMQRTEGAWRRVVAQAVQHGIAVPAFTSSLAYFDGLRRARGPANLIQGLRDYFGAHTYHRLDREGTFHTMWGEDGREVTLPSGNHGVA
jgi:6-phosphogluconate dehydrogenase